ncbi:hypothetical protein HGO23_04035 [Xenorhabdus budapestensis]|uniref:Uncharacterized protein n=1 Tax=Xenorhabdus budapestensis TaxID=290110 RepID=A0ABX7VJ26_XENBU|nr:hypothetical protein [Xenorhabdus budapestensis]QTL40568.1 hypothetical protein HGO23_04035 [Xenorhabdus budapestensis]
MDSKEIALAYQKLESAINTEKALSMAYEIASGSHMPDSVRELFTQLMNAVSEHRSELQGAASDILFK